MSQVTMSAFASAPSRSGLFDRAAVTGTFVRIWRAWTTRRALVDLSARQLDDIGVSREAALAEARRLAWDLAPVAQRFRG